MLAQVADSTGTVIKSIRLNLQCPINFTRPRFEMHSISFILFIFFLSSLQPVTSMATPKTFFVGFDLGTSGARISVIEKAGQTYKEVHSDATLYPAYDDPKSWTNAVHELLRNTPKSLLSETRSICVSGTSASCLLVHSADGKVTRTPKMYDYDITHSRKGVDPEAAKTATSQVNTHAPKNHATRASTSALSKLLHYNACRPIKSHEVLAHQSEYVATSVFLAETNSNKKMYHSDWHNALKLGFDVKMLKYPEWLLTLLKDNGIDADVLPKIVEPGKVIGPISSAIAKQYGLCENAVLVGGTTDSNAAFLASAAAGSESLPQFGIAVTSLGSTLAIKMLSKTFVEDSERGVYSHRFPVLGHGNRHGEEAWLVGGASNVGCAILRQENFSNEELVVLSKNLDISADSSLHYYPLTKIGERFPIADGSKKPVLEPKPGNRSEYLKGILQGISNVERSGFEVLGELGASPPFPEKVLTAGGGSKNDSWLKMRQRLLRESSVCTDKSLKVERAENDEASFGAAILAASTFI